MSKLDDDIIDDITANNIINILTEKMNKGDLEKHEGEVKTYFENRDNLLCLDTGQKDAWSYLCNFLSRTVPQISFPHIK